MTREQLETEVKKSIQETFQKTVDTRATRVKTFNLVHEAGNKYKGILVAETGDKTETAEVSVTCDGRKFMWQIVPPAAQVAASAQPETPSGRTITPEIPSGQETRTSDTPAKKEACTAQLRLIDGAKEQWALENRKKEADVPTSADLFGADKYIKTMLRCPSGGKYALNSIGKGPTCSVHGGLYPSQMELPAEELIPSANQKLQWNKREIDATENGNILVAVQTIQQNPDCKKGAVTPDPAMVAKAPWNHYGKALKFTGVASVVQDFPPNSDFAKMLKSQEACEIVLACADGTIVDMFCKKSSGNLKVGETVSVYGYATGVSQVPNQLGGTFTHLIIVGDSYETMRMRR